MNPHAKKFPGMVWLGLIWFANSIASPGGAPSLPGSPWAVGTAVEKFDPAWPLYYGGVAAFYRDCKFRSEPAVGPGSEMCANARNLAERSEFQMDNDRYQGVVSLRNRLFAHFRTAYRRDSLLGHPSSFQRIRLIAFLDSTDFATETIKAPVDSASKRCMAGISDDLKRRPPLSRHERESLAFNAETAGRLWKSLPDSTRLFLTLVAVIPDFPGLLHRARYVELVPRAAPLFHSPAVQLAYREYALKELLRSSSLPGSTPDNPASLRRIYYHKMAIILSDALWEHGEPESAVPVHLSSYIFGGSYDLPKRDSILIVERARAFGQRFHALRARMGPFNRSDTLKEKFEHIDSLINLEIVAIDVLLSRRLSEKFDRFPGEHVELNIPGAVFPEFIPNSSLALQVRKWVRNISSSGSQDMDSAWSPLIEWKNIQVMKAAADSGKIDKKLNSILRSGGMDGQKLRLAFAKELYFPYNGPLNNFAGMFRLN
jgi:hypothetical protein